MLPDRVSNPGPLTYESGALPIALRGRLISTSLARGVRDMSHANRTVECLNNQSRTKGDCRPQTASPHPFRFLPPPPPHTHTNTTRIPVILLLVFPTRTPPLITFPTHTPLILLLVVPRTPPPPHTHLL